MPTTKLIILRPPCFVPSGSPYYNNVRPLCYSDSDAVLLCFDISRPETVESSLKKVLTTVACDANSWTTSKSYKKPRYFTIRVVHEVTTVFVVERSFSGPWFNLVSVSLVREQWKSEIQDFCSSTKILLIGCKTDLRTDVCTRMELSNQRQSPISHEQVRSVSAVTESVFQLFICTDQSSRLMTKRHLTT